MSWTKEEADRVLAQIVQRSQKDPAFRRLCLENAAAAVKQIAGQDLPPDFKLRFVDRAYADLIVVLPEPAGNKAGAGALSDDELSAVSGGVIMQDGLVSLSSIRLVYTAPSVNSYCFAAGTPVTMADGSTRPIETITVGANVLAFDERQRKVVVGRVSEFLNHEAVAIHRAVVEDIREDLLLTTNHPFYSGGGWHRIEDLPLRSELFHYDPSRREASPRRLLALEPTGRTEPVYNLEVEEAHTYFAGGLLVHNGGALGK